MTLQEYMNAVDGLTQDEFKFAANKGYEMTQTQGILSLGMYLWLANGRAA